jgi:hypothetical protein
MEKNKIGCGLITCDRLDFYEKSINSLIKREDIEIVVVNDGETTPSFIPKNYIKTKGRKGVAFSKNKALQFLLNKNCEHIFLMEDDVEIIDKNVFEKYIETSKNTGILHLNYALHGNHNKNPNNGSFNIIKTIEYKNNIKIDLYFNLLGAFSYYHKTVLDEIGLMDEEFYNAMEHVYHTYLSIEKNFHPPFRYFADVHESFKYLKDIVPDHQQSKIRGEDFINTFKKGVETFIKKTGFSVVQNYGPQEKIVSEKECLEKLKFIYEKNKF